MSDPSNGLAFWQTIIASVTGGAVVGSVALITARMNIRHDREMRNRETKVEEAQKALVLLSQDLIRTLRFVSEQDWSDAIYNSGNELVFAFVPIEDALSICIPTLETAFANFRQLRLEIIGLRSKMGKRVGPSDSPEEKYLAVKGTTLAQVGGVLQRKIRWEIRSMIGIKEQREPSRIKRIWTAVTRYLIRRKSPIIPSEK